ncbi:hypothetical protein BTH_I2712 [Burkholderia thailandensis E264]|uniref:Uncharacterized protein n=1 Tax=Burkholderia thailandensis (strain ATCC 700388 / DSM 13276 / CCUG 48851 / CIP 106301 / E264) TaxID=271848 RepID=Q2SV25_BURTA|nr:hypothetical protein BTH_I2712 [Burkholderia thailandensis E264]
MPGDERWPVIAADAICRLPIATNTLEVTHHGSYFHDPNGSPGIPAQGSSNRSGQDRASLPQTDAGRSCRDRSPGSLVARCPRTPSRSISDQRVRRADHRDGLMHPHRAIGSASPKTQSSQEQFNKSELSANESLKMNSSGFQKRGRMTSLGRGEVRVIGSKSGELIRHFDCNAANRPADRETAASRS